MGQNTVLQTYPVLSPGVSQVLASSGSVAAATATATLAAAAGKTNFLSRFTVTAAGATAASSVSLTITGLKGGTITYVYTVVAGATLTSPILDISFPQPLVASGPNVAIVVSMPTLGAGNLAASINAFGYQQ